MGGGLPVVPAAAFDQIGWEKGGPYTHGPFPNPFAVFGRTDGQFMLMDVQDDGGDEICITWTGKRHEIDTGRVDQKTGIHKASGRIVRTGKSRNRPAVSWMWGRAPRRDR